MILNSCPICGHTPVVMSTSLEIGNGHGYPGHFEYYIHCSNDECPLVRKVPMFTTNDIYLSKVQSYFQLYEKWNVEAAKINELILHREDINKQ